MKKLLLIALLITPSAFANQKQEVKDAIKDVEDKLDFIKSTVCNHYTGDQRIDCIEILTVGFKVAEKLGRAKERLGIN